MKFFDMTDFFLRMAKHLPRMLWHRLWIRKDEFHHSLDMDTYAMMDMKADERKRYLTDLIRRRNSAHRRDIGQ